MSTRTVTGLILRPNGSPWRGGVVRFKPLDDTFTLSPDETFPIDTIEAVTNSSGAISVVLVSGLDVAYQVTLPDGEKFLIVVPDGAPITLETLRAAFAGIPIPADYTVGPTGPTGPQGLQGVQGIQGSTGPTGPTGSGTVIVQGNDVTVAAAATMLDFSSDFAVTETPPGEANLALAIVTISNQSKTIAGGVITLDAIASYVGTIELTADTEAAAASDNLDTINVTGTVINGTFLVIRQATSTRDIVLRAGVGGNIELKGGVASVTLGVSTLHRSLLVRVTGGWIELGNSL